MAYKKVRTSQIKTKHIEKRTNGDFSSKCNDKIKFLEFNVKEGHILYTDEANARNFVASMCVNTLSI